MQKLPSGVLLALGLVSSTSCKRAGPVTPCLSMIPIEAPEPTEPEPTEPEPAKPVPAPAKPGAPDEPSPPDEPPVHPCLSIPPPRDMDEHLGLSSEPIPERADDVVEALAAADTLPADVRSRLRAPSGADHSRT